MEKEKITVIIPVYNVEKYLEASVRSVMNQTYRNLKIVCVNDGSTDGSLAILEKLAKEDERIVVVNQENKGVGEARNTGLAHVDTEWFAFCDSDDTLREDTYEKVSSAIDLGVDMVHWGCEVLPKVKTKLYRRDKSYFRIKFKGIVNVTDSQILRSDITLWNKLFKRSIVQKYNIHFEDILYEDYQFVTQYISVSKSVFYIKEKFYRYLRHDGSIMDTTFKRTCRSIDHLKAYAYVYDFFEKHGVLDKYRKSIVNMFPMYYNFAISNATKESIPLIEELATNIYRKHALLQKEIVRIEHLGSVDFTTPNPKNLRGIEHVVSLKTEKRMNVRYKVLRVFGLPVYMKKK